MTAFRPSEQSVRGRTTKRVRERNTQRFLVYYDGGPESLAALKRALDLADTNTEITAVAFLHSLNTNPLPGLSHDQKASAHAALAGAVTNARLRGFNIKTQVITGRDLREALGALAAECGAARVFMGNDLPFTE